jgi:hypothetical protein
MSIHEPSLGAGSLAASTEKPSSQRRYFAGYTDRTGVVLFLTLATFFAAPPPATFTITRLLSLGGLLLLPRVRTDARFWVALTTFAFVGTLRQPILQLDNHHFLELYWLLAVTLASVARDPREVLKRTARLLIGGAFAFATLWKILSPDFVDGSLLTYAVAVNPVVSEVPSVLGWHDGEAMANNQAAVSLLRSDPVQRSDGVAIGVDDRLEQVAPKLAAATVVLEAAIAMVFLFPLPRRSRWLREATLLTFLLTTYAILPVAGFALLLVTMGLAQSDLDDDRGSVLYLALIPVVAAFAARSQLFALFGIAAS